MVALQVLTANDVKNWDRFVYVSEGMALSVLPSQQPPLQQGVEWLPVSISDLTCLLSMLCMSSSPPREVGLLGELDGSSHHHHSAVTLVSAAILHIGRPASQCSSHVCTAFNDCIRLMCDVQATRGTSMMSRQVSRAALR